MEGVTAVWAMLMGGVATALARLLVGMAAPRFYSILSIRKEISK